MLLIAARAASAQDWLNTDVVDFSAREGPLLHEVRSDAQSHDWSQIEKAAYAEPQPDPDPSEEMIVDPTEEVVVEPPCCMPGSPLLSSVYFRVDSFAWVERANDTNVVDERGPMFTLGWEHAFSRTRLRGELFGGRVQTDRAYSESYFWYGSQYNYRYAYANGFARSDADYIGVRGEFDVLFQSDWFPRSNLIAGLGTRYWRKHVDSVKEEAGQFTVHLPSYTQHWWTIYPYVGIETKKTYHPDWRPYGSARLGLTAFTLVDNSLTPTPSILAQFEAGFSNDESSVGLYYDVMSWGFDRKGGHFHPDSAMGFLGIKAALLY